jgi:ketosteroid isomerase-like protein
VTQYTTTIDEIAGTQDFAYMRGTGRLSFVYEKDTLHLEQTNQNMTLTVLARAADGRWRIRRRMWGQMGP